MYKYSVAIVKGNDRKEILLDALKKMENKIPNISGKIVIKPNFLSANTILASTTPETLELVTKFFRCKFPNNEIYIAEGSHVSTDFIDRYNIKNLESKYNVKVLTIDYDEKEWINIEFDDLVQKKIIARISKLYATADYIISLTVPKTHANIGLSLSMKNLVGIIHPDDRQKFHGLSENVPENIKKNYKRQLYDRDDRLGYFFMKIRNLLPVFSSSAKNINLGSQIVRKNLYNLYCNIQPNLCILDGFDGMEGNGPWHGNNAHLKTVIIGNNCVATDLATAKIMNQSTKDIGYVNYIKNLNEFEENTEIIGDTIDKVKKSFKSHKFEPYL